MPKDDQERALLSAMIYTKEHMKTEVMFEDMSLLNLISISTELDWKL